MLEVKDLSFSYNKNKEVLCNISFSISEGEIGVLLGKNGSGKTTLIKNILGSLKYSKGNIYIDNNDLKELDIHKRSRLISYVPQGIEDNDLTVFEAVLSGRIPYLSFRPKDEDLNIVNELLEELNLSNLSNNYVYSLSGGEKQRVCIARALAQKTKVILFDEPSSSLDIKSKLEFYELIKRISKENNVIILISIHSLDEAFLIGDKFILLKEGGVLFEGNKDILNDDNLSLTYEVKCMVKEIDNHKVVLFN